MTNEFLKFSNPELDHLEIDEVVACMKSGWMATGPRVRLFEEKLQAYLRTPYVLALTSGTAALHLALKGFGLKPGDEVITTPMTFVATLNAIVLAGGKPVLVDVDLHTHNLDVNKIEAAITSNTKAILPVHFAGVPADMDPIYALAKKYNLRVLEDAAQAIGSCYKGQIIGSFGDTQIFSFHPNKAMTTGEGGCVTTRDTSLAQEIKIQRFHGIDRDAFNRFSKEGSQEYDVVQPGYKYNMLDMQAAIGIHQLDKLENFIAKRQILVDRYNEAFSNWSELTLPSVPNYACRIAWCYYAPLINPEAAGVSRDEFMQRMKDYDIGTGLHYQAAHLYTYYQENFGYKIGQFPNAELIAERNVSLPLFSSMTFTQQDRVINAMKQIFGK